ncbi:MAG: archaellin/type IV pilin N-terminal domain-containing protein [Thermoplasmatota archaeon]
MTKHLQKIKNLWEDKTGVSPIIAVILMVAITVVLAATIYVWVSGFGGGEGSTATLSLAQIDYEENTDTYTLKYRVNDAEGGLGWEDIEVTLAGTPIWDGGAVSDETFTITSGGSTSTGDTTGKISAGDTFEYTTTTDDDDPLGKTVNIFDINGDNILWSASVHY